jgi:hypothetical protein
MVEVPSKSRGGPLRAAKWLIVAALGGVAALLLTELALSASAVEAQSESPLAGRNVIAVPGQITRDSYGVYLVDPEKGTICVYQYLVTAKSLRLLASRNYVFDVQLDDYNTQPPPRQIKELVEQQRRLTSPAAGGEAGTTLPAGS